MHKYSRIIAYSSLNHQFTDLSVPADCQLLLSPLIVMLQCNVYWPQICGAISVTQSITHISMSFLILLFIWLPAMDYYAMMEYGIVELSPLLVFLCTKSFTSDRFLGRCRLWKYCKGWGYADMRDILKDTGKENVSGFVIVVCLLCVVLLLM